MGPSPGPGPSCYHMIVLHSTITSVLCNIMLFLNFECYSAISHFERHGAAKVQVQVQVGA